MKNGHSRGEYPPKRWDEVMDAIEKKVKMEYGDYDFMLKKVKSTV